MFVFNTQNFPQGIDFLLCTLMLPVSLADVLFNPPDSLLDIILVDVVFAGGESHLLATFLFSSFLLLLCIDYWSWRLDLALQVIIFLHLGL